MAWETYVTPLTNVATSIFGGLSSANEAKRKEAASRYATDQNRQLTEQQSILNILSDENLRAITEAFARQAAGATAAEQQYAQGQLSPQYQQLATNLSNMFNQAPQELEQLKQDIQSQQAKELQQGTQALQSNINRAGVRGGQAATLLGRGIADITDNANRDLNAIIANEAINRRGQERSYTAGLSDYLYRNLYDPTRLGQMSNAINQFAPITNYQDTQGTLDKWKNYFTPRGISNPVNMSGLNDNSGFSRLARSLLQRRNNANAAVA